MRRITWDVSRSLKLATCIKNTTNHPAITSCGCTIIHNVICGLGSEAQPCELPLVKLFFYWTHIAVSPRVLYYKNTCTSKRNRYRAWTFLGEKEHQRLTRKSHAFWQQGSPVLKTGRFWNHAQNIILTVYLDWEKKVSNFFMKIRSEFLRHWLLYGLQWIKWFLSYQKA